MVRQYERAVGSDQAQVDIQKLNLVYCRITSPAEGRVGLRQVDAGNYVTASDTNGIVVVT
jgi:multidrug efflux system membrane fusion protein